MTHPVGEASEPGTDAARMLRRFTRPVGESAEMPVLFRRMTRHTGRVDCPRPVAA